MEVKGAVALVTGGGSGIGRATALRLARDGAVVAVNDIDEPSARETTRLIEEAAGWAMPVPADVSSETAVPRMIAATRARFGRLDILVNNAGVVEAGTTQRIVFPELEPERWMRTLDINVRGVLLGTQYAIAIMREQGGGVIINVSSMAGIGVGPHPAPVYAASKAAVVRFSAALAPLAKRMNIRVNCICPDWVETPMVQRGRAEMSPAEWQAIAPQVMTQPDEIAEAVVRLVGDDSLAGRVMLCVGPKPWPLIEPRGA
ncbi:MAG TPA: SDR family oxidoreductase [Methylomirabilota bacterium]|nr:SDR family oxidoreductase [Methylomirabilota bacterium]